MNEQYNPVLQAKLEDFIKEAGSQAKAVKTIGISSSVISQYRRSSYENGNILETEARLAEFFRIKDEKKEQEIKAKPFKPVTGAYAPTDFSEKAYKLIRYCQIEKGIAIIHGDAGIGKTKAAQKFVNDNPKTAVLISANPISGKSAGNIIKVLAGALKLTVYNNNLKTWVGVYDSLYNSSKVIIIDEAQHLKHIAIEQLRGLSEKETDDGREGVGLVLIGNSEVYDRMRGKQKSIFAQQFSRTLRPLEGRTADVCMNDIKKIFPYLEENNMRREQSFLFDISKSEWNIRSAVRVYNNSVNKGGVYYEILRDEAFTLGIPVGIME